MQLPTASLEPARRDQMRDRGEGGDALRPRGRPDEDRHPVTVDRRLLVAVVTGEAFDPGLQPVDDPAGVGRERHPHGLDVAPVLGHGLPAFAGRATPAHLRERTGMLRPGW